MEDVYLTADKLARLHGVSVGTIYRWASEDVWPRTSVKRRPVRYSSRACEVSATRRRENQANTAP